MDTSRASGRLKWRQDSGQAGRQKRFARAWRPAHQQIVTAGRRNLERALGDFLSIDLPKVRPAENILSLSRLRRLQYGCSLEVSKKR